MRISFSPAHAHFILTSACASHFGLGMLTLLWPAHASMGPISSREQSQGHIMGLILIGTLRVDVILGLYQAGDVSRGHYMGFKPSWNIFLGTLHVAPYGAYTK